MATDNSFVDYTGNAGLGLGSNTSIPAIGTASLDGVNDLGQHLMQLDAGRNYNLFQQKVKDRDALLQMIDQDKINVGDVREADQKMVDDSHAAVENAYVELGKNGGINNPEAYRKYKQAVYDAKNIGTQAQYRKAQEDILKKQQAESDLEDERTKIGEHIKTQFSSGFWGDITPYQKTLSYDLPKLTTFAYGNALKGEAGQQLDQTTTQTKIGPKGTTVTQTVKPIAGAGAKGAKGVGASTPQAASELYDYVPGSYLSFGAIRDNLQGAFGGDLPQTQNMQKLFNDFASKVDKPEFAGLIERMNSKIKDYNEFRGLAPNDPDYAQAFTEKDFTVDPETGKHIMTMSVPDFAARVALATAPSFGQKGTYQWNKDKAGYNIQLKRLDADQVYKMGMLGVAQKKANAYVDNVRQQMKYRKTDKEKDELLNNLWTENFLQQDKLLNFDDKTGQTIGRGAGVIVNTKLDANKSAPIYTILNGNPTQLVPIGGKPVYSDDAYKGTGDKRELRKDAKPTHYEGGHYIQKFLVGDNAVGIKELQSGYKIYKSKNPSYAKDFEGYLKDAIKNNGVQVTLQGANGTVNRTLFESSMRLMSNRGTKKGQDGVFASDEDAPLEETSVTTSESNYDNERADNQQ